MEIIIILIVFLIGYYVFETDPFKVINEKKTFNKDFIGCYIIKYPNRTELHNKGLIYIIDFDKFFELNLKLIGRIKIEERPQINEDNLEAELQFRKQIKNDSKKEERDFWEKSKKK